MRAEFCEFDSGGFELRTMMLVAPSAAMSRNDDDHGSNAKNDAEACERRTQLVKPEIVQAELDDFEEESRLHARYQHCAAQSALQSRW